MRSILITGGAGFIGSHLVNRILSEGDWRVFAVDDFNDFYEPKIKHANIAEFQTDRSGHSKLRRPITRVRSNGF